ncbi:MAG TPA: C45 family autoproteolytic acyltransferase/hydrolase [Phycisphaerae bacterium]|nr:C45 family autoproteolytic acyltransferase/hydrolase [Phycisphaerae bacterium]HRW51391.1 C45 family autoproteolytic acyltransferase/hydrolase [Phycisphaerae bacterium]
MSGTNRVWIRMVFLCLLAPLFFPQPLRAADPDQTPTIRGELTQVDGVRVLRVTGDAADRGFAHGYLMAREIIDLIDGYLQAKDVSGGPRQFEALARGLTHVMAVPSPFLVEIDGMLAGIEKRLDGNTTIPLLNRKLTRNDLVVMNCVPDAVGFGCSSFMAWGNRTKDGKTITGRNLDWHSIDALRNTQLVIAHIPAKDSKEAAWLSVAWPGMIGCLTGMNERGVTLSMHDGPTKRGVDGVEATPRGFALRMALETARPGHLEEDVLSVFQKNRVMVGNIVPVSGPSSGETPPAMVFEYDNVRKNAKGVTVRHAGAHGTEDAAADDYQIATNHFRERSAAQSCNRYEKLSKTFEKSRDDPIVTLARAWKLLERVSMNGGGLVTYQSVIFEPDDMKMHVSFSTADDVAPNGKRVTLNVADLLKRPVSVAASGE